MIKYIYKEKSGNMQIIIANIIALIASIVMVYSGYLKTNKKIIYAQSIQIGLLVVSNIILGGITGAIINLINCIRNILCYKEKLNNVCKIVLIILSTILTLSFNNLGFIGLLPLISGVTYILLIDIKDVIKFKYMIIFTTFLWGCYDLYVKSYTSACFDFICIIVIFVSIIQLNNKNS